MTIKFIIDPKGSPVGKLADAELHFDTTFNRQAWAEAIERLRDAEQDEAAEDLAILTDAVQAIDGLKLVGFAVWERRGGGRNVTFPARQYSVNGERRSFALLRPIGDAKATDRLRDRILEAYAAFEQTIATSDIPATGGR